MARSSFQKLKLLYIYEFFLRNTDEKHGASVNDIIAYLDENGIKAERKSIYNDIDLLEAFGADIIRRGPGGREYCLVSREFEAAELKVLADLVQCSRFLSNERSGRLIDKLGKLCSRFEADELRAHTLLRSPVKNSSEYNVFYNVDSIFEAIVERERIGFLYYHYDSSRVKRYGRGGARYEVCPLMLKWADEKYYLLCMDGAFGDVRAYRVDRMEDIERTGVRFGEVSDEVRREVERYDSAVFSMFRGRFERVRLEFDEALAGVAIDRFGGDAIMCRDGDGRFTVNCEVAVSGQFFGWLAGLGEKVRIVAPVEVAREYREYLLECARVYED